MMARRREGLLSPRVIAFLMGSLVGQEAALANEVEGTRWVVRQQTDPVTLETVISAAIMGLPDSQPRYLILTCYPEHGALYAVHTFGRLDLAADETRQMTERIDTEQPNQRVWQNMPQGKFGTFLNHEQAMNFARDAMRAKTTIALAWRDRRARWTARGSTAAIEKVLEACNVEP